MSDAVTATDEGQQEKLFRQAGNIIEKSLEKVRLASFTDIDKSINNRGIQVNIFQKLLFLHQLTQNMAKDCSLIYQFNT